MPSATCPRPSSLAKVFDAFVLDTSHAADGEMMEAAGAQCLLLAGFFEDQMRRRHAIRWYAELGAGFYQRASVHQQSARKARLLCAIAKRFEIWRQLHAQLSRVAARPAIPDGAAATARGLVIG